MQDFDPFLLDVTLNTNEECHAFWEQYFLKANCMDTSMNMDTTHAVSSIPVQGTWRDKSDDKTADVEVENIQENKFCRWTIDEHRLFLIAVERDGMGGNWKYVSKFYVKTRTPKQIASHAQKYYNRKDQETKRRKSVNDMIISNSDDHMISINNQPLNTTVPKHDTNRVALTQQLHDHQLLGTEDYMKKLFGDVLPQSLVQPSTNNYELPLHYYQQIGANSSTSSFTSVQQQIPQFPGQQMSDHLFQPQLPQSFRAVFDEHDTNRVAPTQKLHDHQLLGTKDYMKKPFGDVLPQSLVQPSTNNYELPLHYYQQIGANSSTSSFTSVQQQIPQFPGQQMSDHLFQPQLPQCFRVVFDGNSFNYYPTMTLSENMIMNPNNVALHQQPLDYSRAFPFNFDDNDPADFPRQ